MAYTPIQNTEELVPGFYTYLATKSRFPEMVRVRFFYRKCRHSRIAKGDPSIAYSLEVKAVRNDWKLLEGPFKTRQKATQ